MLIKVKSLVLKHLMPHDIYNYCIKALTKCVHWREWHFKKYHSNVDCVSY